MRQGTIGDRELSMAPLELTKDDHSAFLK